MAPTDRTRWHRRIYFSRHFKGAALAGFLAGPGFRLRHMLLGRVISLLRPGFSGPGRILGMTKSFAYGSSLINAGIATLIDKMPSIS